MTVTPPRFVLLSADLGFLRSSRMYPEGSLADKALSLAAAVARSPLWREMGSGCLVLRQHGTPLLAALGHFDEVDTARLQLLARWLPEAVATTRYLDYAAVTDAVLRLADMVRSSVGSAVRDFDIAGIPRGGQVVQGLLAYALGVDAETLDRPPDASRPLLVVDDCALTGSRFRRFMDGHEREHVIFAHLCSPVAMRGALLAAEPSVRHVLAAVDLQDLTAAEPAADATGWRLETGARIDDARYWLGQSEIVVFPWSEPDHNFWNPVAERMEWGWRIAPPDVCLKTRTAEPAVEVVIEGQGVGAYTTPDNVLAVLFDGAVAVTDLETGSTLGLRGVAAAIWQAVMRGEPPALLAERVAREYGVPASRVANDVDVLLRELVERGLLQSRSHQRN